MDSLSAAGYAISELDRLRFGVRTAKAFCGDLDTWRVVGQQLIAEQIELALIRVPVSAIDVAQIMQKEGAVLCDVLAWFERALTSAESEGAVVESRRSVTLGPSLVVRPVHANEGRVLGEWAVRVFEDYRNHYAADKRLLPEQVREVYPDWLRRLHASDEAAVWAMACGEDLVGVAALTGQGQAHRDVALFGMEPAFAGQGFGGRFLDALVGITQQERCQRMTYSTQTRNLAARRMACRAGFLPSGDCFVFHVWTDRWVPCR